MRKPYKIVINKEITVYAESREDAKKTYSTTSLHIISEKDISCFLDVKKLNERNTND